MMNNAPKLTYDELVRELKFYYEKVSFSHRRIDQFLADIDFLKDPEAKLLLLVDFSELFRVLHSDLDNLLFDQEPNKTRFFIEHVALNYAFYKTGNRLFLVFSEPYFEEFKDHFKKIKDRVEEYLEQVRNSGEEGKFYLSGIKENPHLKTLFDLYASYRKNPEKVNSLVNFSKQYFVDLVIEARRNHYIKRGLRLFNELVEKNFLGFSYDFPELAPIDDMTQENIYKDTFYKFVYNSLCKISQEQVRKPRKIPNERDAWALTLIYRCNEAAGLDPQKTKVAIFSSSRKMMTLLYNWNYYAAYYATHEESGDSLDSRYYPEIRDVYYILLHIYREKLDEQCSVLSDLAAVRDQLNTITNQINAVTTTEFGRYLQSPEPDTSMEISDDAQAKFEKLKSD